MKITNPSVTLKDGLWYGYTVEVPRKTVRQIVGEFMQLPTHRKQSIAHELSLKSTYYEGEKTIVDSDRDLIRAVVEANKRNEFNDKVSASFKTYHISAYQKESDYEAALASAKSSAVKISNQEEVSRVVLTSLGCSTGVTTLDGYVMEVKGDCLTDCMGLCEECDAQQVATISPIQKQDPFQTHADRDWPEDFEMENGNYVNKCIECKLFFRGHKRRCICKTCGTAPPDWHKIAEMKRPEDKKLCAYAGCWLQGEMVGFAKCMVKHVIPMQSQLKRDLKQMASDNQEERPIEELFLEEYYRLPADCSDRGRINTDYGDLVNLLTMFKEKYFTITRKP